MDQGTCPGSHGKPKSEKVLERRQREEISVAFVLSKYGVSIAFYRHDFA